MARQKLTERSSVLTASANAFVHVVEGGVSYKIKKSDFLGGIASGYVGALAIADTPTVDGYYLAEESGTYTNAGGLVVDLNNTITYISVEQTQTSFVKIEIPITDKKVNVDDFGAVGDGVTDDSSAIQSAIDYALANFLSNVYFGAKTYAIESPIKWKQTTNLIGTSTSSGSVGGTEILCNFSAGTIATPPTDIYTGSYSVVLDYTPMLYNGDTGVITQQYIQDIRFNGNNKDVYGIYINEMYYTSFNRLTIINCNESPFTVWKSQFCQHEQISITGCSGSIRILESSGTYFNGLDVENMSLDDAVLKILTSVNKEGVWISNFWYEEPVGGHSTIECDLITIGQRGTAIYPVQATYSGTGQKRYINLLLDGTNAGTFDGVSITTSQANRCRVAENLFSSVGGDIKLKVASGANEFEIIGGVLPISLIESLGGSGRERLGIQSFSQNFEVYNKDYSSKKINFVDDNTINFNNIYIEASGADRIIENPSGRLRFKANGSNPDTSIQTKQFQIYDSAGTNNGDWQDGLLRLGGYYLWFDASGNLMRSTSTSLPTSDSDGVVIGTQT